MQELISQKLIPWMFLTAKRQKYMNQYWIMLVTKQRNKYQTNINIPIKV